jgi:hypothetical protein
MPAGSRRSQPRSPFPGRCAGPRCTPPSSSHTTGNGRRCRLEAGAPGNPFPGRCAGHAGTPPIQNIQTVSPHPGYVNWAFGLYCGGSGAPTTWPWAAGHHRLAPSDIQPGHEWTVACRRARPEGQFMKISAEVFEAYLDCPTKCYLRSRGETASGNPYSDWVDVRMEAYRAAGIGRLMRAVPQGECLLEQGAADGLRGPELPVPVLPSSPGSRRRCRLEAGAPGNPFPGRCAGPRCTPPPSVSEMAARLFDPKCAILKLETVGCGQSTSGG